MCVCVSVDIFDHQVKLNHETVSEIKSNHLGGEEREREREREEKKRKTLCQHQGN